MYVCAFVAAKRGGRRVAEAGSIAVLAVEAVGSLSMWSAIPVACLWIAARVYEATDSLLAGGVVALFGLVAAETLVAKVLARLDSLWLSLRRHAGHEQHDGVLTRVVVVTATIGLPAFYLWFYVLSGAFVIPFMPLR